MIYNTLILYNQSKMESDHDRVPKQSPVRVPKQSLVPVPKHFNNLEEFFAWAKKQENDKINQLLEGTQDRNTARKIVVQLLLIYHPDRCSDPNATEYAKTLNECKDELDNMNEDESRSQGAAEAEARSQAAEAEAEARRQAAEAEARRQAAEAKKWCRAAEAAANRQKPWELCKHHDKPRGCMRPDCPYAHGIEGLRIPYHLLQYEAAVKKYLSDKLEELRRTMASASDEKKKILDELYATRYHIPGTKKTFKIYPGGIMVYDEHDQILERHDYNMYNAKKTECLFGSSCGRMVCTYRHPSETAGMFHMVLQGRAIRLMRQTFCLRRGTHTAQISWWIPV